jgi:hypothetical protein
MQRWFPLLLLIIFTIGATLALVGMAKNFAQKRTVFADPLCKGAWEKMYRVEHNSTHEKSLEEKSKKS